MRSLIFVFILGLITITNSYSYEIKAEFENRSESADIVEGESFDVYLRIWPFENEDVEFVKKSLEEKKFLDFFFIAKVYSVSFSKNNETVMEVYAKAILTKHYVPRQFYLWNYKSLTIPFDIININPVRSNSGKDFVITEQSYDSKIISKGYNLLIFGVIAVLISLFVFFGMKIYLKKKRLIEEINSQKEMWNNLFQSTKSRSDLEKIYMKKDKWLELVGGETPPILHFLTTVNSIQFKEEWSEFEKLQVDDAFDEIRGMFERN